uniref:Uncharacterized protein n=1 Tax=Solanum lycopersicum TaxID=4081 RepID=A0A3Q7HJ82_SOLLC
MENQECDSTEEVCHCLQLQKERCVLEFCRQEVCKLQLSFLVDNLTPFSFVVIATYITTFYFWFETGLQLIDEVWILVISIQYKIVDCRFFMGIESSGTSIIR